ncbi:MAG: NAD-dependent epimerase/dehydratase family protein [Alphaproteobacteria bacterium]|nr:NAD-dependent epimerase/dehydratase family protein [Alphaproteobacteria bacterium]
MARLNLVTGGAGFVGRHLVKLLAGRGERVRVLDLDRPGDAAPDVEYLQGSILDEAALDRAMQGAERVFHLAANPNLWHRRPETFLETNLRGTEMVLRAASRHRPEKTVYCSTESILKSYRWTKVPGKDGRIDERIELRVDDMPGPYCRSKFLAERAAMDAAASGQPVVIVNPTLPIGPGDLRLTPPSRMLIGFLNGRIPAFLESEFNLIDVRDVAEGHILAAEKGRIGERYILGHRNLRLSELLALLQRLTGLPIPRMRVPYALAFAAALVDEGLSRLTGRPPNAPITGVRLARTPMVFDCAKAIEELGLPQTPIETALTDFIRFHRQQGEIERPIPALGI